MLGKELAEGPKESKGRTMNCQSVENWLWREGAGNLPAAAAEHASKCTDCRNLIEQVRILDRSVGSSIVPEPGDAYWQSMRERVAQSLDRPTDRVIEMFPQVPAWRRWVARVWAPAVGVALLAVVASQRSLEVQPVKVLTADRIADRVSELANAGPKVEEVMSERDAVTPRMAQPSEGQELAGEVTPPSAPSAAPEKMSTAEAASRSEWVAKEPVGLKEMARPTQPAPESALASNDEAKDSDGDEVWPERQVTIMGLVDSNGPNKLLKEDPRLASQDPFGAYEREMAESGQGLESAGTFASPGRLLDGPAAPTIRGSERLTPAQQMRRFDEISELRELIGRLEDVPAASRAMSQWTQWSTAWYRLGMLAEQTPVVDSALMAVGYFLQTVPLDANAGTEWAARKSHLETRRANLKD